MAALFSTPVRRTTSGSKPISAENFKPPSNTSQKDLIKHAGGELADATWEMDASSLARVLSAKKRKTRFENIESKDSISEYDVDLDRCERVMKKASEFTPPQLPDDAKEIAHYEPLQQYLNQCLDWCREALGSSSKGYNRELRFSVWDRPTKDGVEGTAAIKPDLAGAYDLPEKPETLSWRPKDGLRKHTMEIPVEVKGDWPQLLSQAATYARCLFDAVPSRVFALVLGYNHKSKELRFLCFHAGGLTASKALKPNSANGTTQVIQLLLSLLTWETRGDAGFPEWESNGVMYMQKDELDVQGQKMKIESVLYNRLGIRGRNARVLLVKPIDSSEQKLPEPYPPEVVAQTLRRSIRIQEKDEAKKASQSIALDTVDESPHVTVFGTKVSNTKRSSQYASQKKGEPVYSKRQADRQPPIMLYNSSESRVQLVRHTITAFTQPITLGAQHVVKLSWVEHSTAMLESEMFNDCSGMFGVISHFYSSLVHNKDGVPATNHLFLENVDFWPVYKDSHSTLPFKDFRALHEHISEFAGESLVKADSPKSLFLAIIHAMIGYRNILEKGYQHRDISIGNVLWLRKAKTMTNALDMLRDLELRAFLEEHGIGTECHGFVIDGDMAVKLKTYLPGGRRSSRSGTEEFMSDELRETPAKLFQTPIDDLWSFYWVAQWAAVFNSRHFSSPEQVPQKVQNLRMAVAGTHRDRGYASFEITTIPTTHRDSEYGAFLFECRSIFKLWYQKLRELAMPSSEEFENPDDPYATYFPEFKSITNTAIKDLVDIITTHYSDNPAAPGSS